MHDLNTIKKLNQEAEEKADPTLAERLERLEREERGQNEINTQSILVMAELTSRLLTLETLFAALATDKGDSNA
jgi:hypothetical protein